MVTRQTRRRVAKAREERFVKNLTEARDRLDEVIEKAEDGDRDAFDSLEQFSEQMSRVYRQAERLDSE